METVATSAPGQLVEGLERLSVEIPLPTDPVAAARAFERPDWLGPAVDAPPGVRRHLTDLSFQLITKPRTIVFRKAAVVDLGRVVALPDGSRVVEVAWRSATLAPLFPVFSGRLSIRADGLHLDGVYAPPLGEVGRLIDRAALHQVAVRTGRWFLERASSAVAAGTPDVTDP
jgi:hypothetical protein